ncbi:MAG: hypothetical protein ACLTKH_03105 [Eubacterium sp.]
MRSVYLYDNGGSIVLSHPRGYYAEYSDNNTIGYKDASERASRMYELRQEWSEAVNNAISSGNKISDYNNTVYYDYGVLDKDNNGTIDSITIIYKNNGAGNISVSCHHHCGIIQIMLIIFLLIPAKKLLIVTNMSR